MTGKEKERKMYVFIFGDRPNLLLIHGSVNNGPIFDAVCEEINAHFSADYKLLPGNGIRGLLPTMNGILTRFFDKARTSPALP